MKTTVLFLFALWALLGMQLHAQDEALFTVDHNKVCLGTPIWLTDRSTGGNGNVVYLFGDGTQSTPSDPNPMHIYTAVSPAGNPYKLKQILPISGSVIDPETGNPVGYKTYTLPITVVPNTKLSAHYTLQSGNQVTVYIHDTRFDAYDIDFGDGSPVSTVLRNDDTTTITHSYSNNSQNSILVKGKFSAGNFCPAANVDFPVRPVAIPPAAYHPLGTTQHTGTAVFSSGNELHALHVDSMKAGYWGLSHYFLKTLDIDGPSSNDCISFKAGWTGPMIQHDYYGRYLFFFDEDTIYLEADKELNESWYFADYDNDEGLLAVVTAKEQLNFLGLTDSVKTIQLFRKNFEENSDSVLLDGGEIKLSKHYGLLKTIGFRDYPTITSYELVGLTNPAVGLQLLTTRKLYNYAVGDEFHYEKNYRTPTTLPEESKRIDLITSKNYSTNADTVIYGIRRQTETRQQHPGTGEWELINTQTSDITEKYAVNDSPLYPSNPNPHATFSINPDVHDRLQWSTAINRFEQTDENCWQLRFWGPGDPDSLAHYLEGCGLVYLENIHGSAQDYEDVEELVYYKKGSEEYGSRMVLSNQQRKSNQSIMLYPNPLKEGEQLHINTGEFRANRLFIYNAIGNKVLEITETGNDISSADVSSLQSGLYIVKLVNEKNEYATSKLIVK